MKKESVNIDVLIRSRNGEKKMMQSIRTKSRHLSRIRK